MGFGFSKADIFKPSIVAGIKGSRFIDPHDCEEISESLCVYANAEKFADEIGDVPSGYRSIAILYGRFIFGDFIEAMIVKNNWDVEHMTISTLSMSQDNIDSLKNLLDGDYVRKMDIIVSHYYFATERSGLMPYLYEHLDKDDKFQLSVASVHTKICLIKTSCGKTISIHGSANLRSSANIEQICIETSAETYSFFDEIHAKIVERHKTIKKAVRGDQLWQAVLAGNQENQENQEKQDQPQTRLQKSAVQNANRRAGV